MSRCLTNLLLLWTTPSWESTGHEATSSAGVTNPLQLQCTGTSEPADAMHVPSKSETSSRAASHVQSMLKTSLRAHSKQDTRGTCWVYSAWADNQRSTQREVPHSLGTADSLRSKHAQILAWKVLAGMMTPRAQQICPSPIKMHEESGDAEILHQTWSFNHKDMDLLQDIAKSAKNNTSDWKTDWKIRVFWHCLIKLCCFSHQDCQQKAKHIARIQFHLQADTKWHSFLASSLCCAPSHLAYQPPWQATSTPGAALPQEHSDLCSAHKPREPSRTGHRVPPSQAGAASLGKDFSEQWKHLQQPRVLIHLCKAEQIPTRLCTAAPLPTWAPALQGEWIHPELLAALLKHPVNHFAVFKSKKCNEKKPKGLPWLCH